MKYALQSYFLLLLFYLFCINTDTGNLCGFYECLQKVVIIACLLNYLFSFVLCAHKSQRVPV